MEVTTITHEIQDFLAKMAGAPVGVPDEKRHACLCEKRFNIPPCAEWVEVASQRFRVGLEEELMAYGIGLLYGEITGVEQFGDVVGEIAGNALDRSPLGLPADPRIKKFDDACPGRCKALAGR